MGLLRVLLALAVVIEHADRPFFGLTLVRGLVAVHLFFIISGFYMALVLTEKYTPERDPGYRMNFYKSRFFRLYPCFLVVSLAVVLCGGLYAAVCGQLPYPSFSEAYRRTGWWSATVVASNATMVGQDVVHCLEVAPDGQLSFQPSVPIPGSSRQELAEAMLVSPAWSLGCEIWFYLLAPWLLRQSPLVAGALFLGSVGIRLGMPMIGLSPLYFFPAKLYFFLAGMYAYKWLYRHPLASNRGVGWVALISIIAGVIANQWIASKHYEIVLYALLAIGIASVFRLTARWRWDRVIGEHSYPLYLVHLLVLTAVEVAAAYLGTDWNTEVVVAAALLASAVLYRFVDVPIDEYRRRFSQPAGRSESGSRLAGELPTDGRGSGELAEPPASASSLAAGVGSGRAEGA